MTTKRTHTCNLCHDEIPGPYGGAEAGYGINFTNMHDFKLVKVREAENHVCNRCIEQLAEFWKSQPE